MTRLGPVFLFVVLFQLALWPATPTITNISVTTDTNTAVVTYNVSPDSYCWVQYGVASKTYLWSSATFLSATLTPGVCSVAITGLKDGTTYYFLPTARPNPDDETNICAASGCGAVEQVTITPDATVSHFPAPPVSVSANLLAEPDTSGYAIVNLIDGGSGAAHECVSAQNVTAPAGYSWTITAGETLTAIIARNAMTYGTVFQVPQGTTCIVNSSYVPNGLGYQLPVLAVDPLATGGSIDAANHRWIIFRTVPGGTADFPPFGVRTGPSFFRHYGGFQSNTPCTTGFGTLDGAIFQTNGQAHHYWIENLMFSVDDTQTTANYGSFFELDNGEGGGTPPFAEYIVIRGNYFHGPNRAKLTDGTPSISAAILGTMAGQVAIVGNYFDNLWYHGQVNTTGSGIIQGIYFMDCGTSATCNTGGPVLIDNNYMHGMAMNVYVEANNQNNPAAAHDFTVTHNYLYWPYDSAYPYAQAIGGYGCRNQIEFKDMVRSSITGNYINGQWACADTGPPILLLGSGTTTDILVRSNYITKAVSVFAISGSGGETVAESRQATGNRYLVTNNLAYDLGRGKYDAGGGGLGTQLLSIGTPVSNLALTNNTIVGPFTDVNGSFCPWVLEYGGGASGQVAGFQFTNNIVPFGVPVVLFGAGIFTQIAQTSSGMLSHPATPSSINSGVWSFFDFTQFLGSAFGYTSAVAGLGMQGASVISGGKGYPNTGKVIFTGCTTEPVATFNAVNGVIAGNYATGALAVNFTSYGSGCDPARMTATADSSGGGSGAVLRPAYGVTPSYEWSGNVVVCTDHNGSDMSMSDCSTFSSTMPHEDVYASGATTAERLAAAGVTSDYSISPTVANAGDAGANLDTIYSDTGTVTGVKVAVTESAALISYTAPDERACSVDVSPDGTQWTRVTDFERVVRPGPGPRPVSRWRTARFTGLNPRSAYQYRVLCYFEQTSDLFSGDQITDGTFSTLAAGTTRPEPPGFNRPLLEVR